MVAHHDHAAGLRLIPEEQVAQLARKGDLGATEFLVEKYRDFVITKARLYFVRGADKDDVVQEGMIGLCKAIRDFRCDRKSRFRPFAELCVTRQIISAVKAATRHKHDPLNSSFSYDRISADANVDSPSWIEKGAATDISNPEVQTLLHAEHRLMSRWLRSELSPLERQVLIGYANGLTYRELSSQLQCPTKSVDNALQRAKRKMSRALSNGS